MTGELFNPEAFEQMPGQMAFEQVEIRPQTGSRVEVHKDDRGLSIRGQSRGLHGEWALVRCHCCRQDFYTDPAHREAYCPRCMELGR